MLQKIRNGKVARCYVTAVETASEARFNLSSRNENRVFNNWKDSPRKWYRRDDRGAKIQVHFVNPHLTSAPLQH